MKYIDYVLQSLVDKKYRVSKENTAVENGLSSLSSFIKIGYIVYLWKNKKLEVRNSPIDHIASLTLKLTTCIKGACVLSCSYVKDALELH